MKRKSKGWTAHQHHKVTKDGLEPNHGLFDLGVAPRECRR